MSIVAESACYRCLFEAPPPPGAAPSCSEAGILGAFAGIIGALQAKEALAILDGKPALAGALLVVDGKNNRRRTVRIKRRPDCEAHARHALSGDGKRDDSDGKSGREALPC